MTRGAATTGSACAVPAMRSGSGCRCMSLSVLRAGGPAMASVVRQRRSSRLYGAVCKPLRRRARVAAAADPPTSARQVPLRTVRLMSCRTWCCRTGADAEHGQHGVLVAICFCQADGRGRCCASMVASRQLGAMDSGPCARSSTMRDAGVCCGTCPPVPAAGRERAARSGPAGQRVPGTPISSRRLAASGVARISRGRTDAPDGSAVPGDHARRACRVHGTATRRRSSWQQPSQVMGTYSAAAAGRRLARGSCQYRLWW